MPLELVNQLPYNHPYRWDGTLFGGPKLWRPTEITTALWLDAEDTSTITLNGATVSQWADKSGNGRNAVQATAANQPTYNATGLNSKPTLTADTTKFLVANATGFSGGPNLWVIAVATMNSATQSYGRLVAISAPPLDDFNAVSTTVAILRNDAANSVAAYRVAIKSQVAVSLSTPSILESVYDSVNHTMYLNGTAGTPVASTGNFTTTPTIALFTYLVSPTVAGWSGNCSEVIIGDSALSTDNRQKLEGYLAWKWGLQAGLPVGHPYKNTPPIV
jgi:hypothetical protein